MDSNNVTYFAETDARNKRIKFGIKAKDRLKHMYVIGKTGMGKSTLLENLAIQDIQNGNGLAFIDPHGGTAEKLLDYIPENRIKDVLYFAPFDMEHPVSFNVMEDIGIDKRHLVVNGLMSTFEKIWVDAWSARMAYILNNTLLALLEYPGSTLLGVNRMLSDKEYRKKVVANIQDTSVKAFWVEEFGKWTEKFIAEAIPAIQNKVGQFTSNPLVRNLLGQAKSTFDIRKMMDEKKILIINLSKGRVGEGNANLLGSMLITKIYLAAMSRADADEKDLAKLPSFYLYVDEFQSFANKSFADILSEARKYKLSLTIAHQYIEQMEEEVRDAVFGNVGTMITFRVGAFDAEVLEKEFAPTFEAADLVNLGFAQIYLKLMIDGVSSQPFSATTMGPIARPEINFKDVVIASSREQFARPRSIVEKEIGEWHGVLERTTPFVPVQNYDQRERLQQEVKKDVIKENHRPEEVIKEKPKVDENRDEFMKAAEELKKRSSLNEVPDSTTKPETISLSSLTSNKDNKKNPSKENISSLKEALSGVISKSKESERQVVSNVTTQKTSIAHSTNQQLKNEEVNVRKEEVKVENKPKESIAEVPENVLRELLNMDEKKHGAK
ncbi:MAG: DUF87 domain-containing protein [Parcubacteria group bacterium]